MALKSKHEARSVSGILYACAFAEREIYKMASVGEASKQDQRIACSSRHNLKILTDAINKQIENVTDKNVTWTDEQKEQYKQRIREVSL